MATAVATNSFLPPLPELVGSSQGLRVLVIDRDRLVREACREAVCTLGHTATTTDSLEQAIWFADARGIDVVLLDWNLPNHVSLELLQQLRRRRPESEVVVLVNNNQIGAAVEAIKAGAFDCLAKPFGLKELKVMLETVTEQLRQREERKTFAKENKGSGGFGSIIGSTPEMDRLYRIISKAAQCTHPVLILGETGTGKELVARFIHHSGPFRENPFIPVDCGSLVPTLIESELFGHVKGAFTSAVQSKPGLLTMAEGGTLFLDEVGELPLDLQSKLLRAIQEKEIRPVGSNKTVPINVRVLAATNRELEQAVGQGQFRRDLYFRLNVLALRIPPLRERRQDIRLLVSRFVERETKQSGRAYQVSNEAMAAMMSYDWPGNVRELENCVEQCCALHSGPTIGIHDLPESISGSQRMRAIVGAEDGIAPIAELERRAILAAIEQLNGDKLKAAKLLGIGKTTLYRKLKEYETLGCPVM